MNNSNLEEKLLRSVEARRNDLLTLCCNLIKAKSENPPGDVSEAASIAKDYLKKNGLKVEAHEAERGYVNLLTTIGEGEPTLILNGHIDVVPTGDAGEWSFPPLLGEIRDGRILGRGATDMKGGVAAILTAMVALSQVEDKLPNRVTATIVCDEETGGRRGTRWLAEQGLLKGDACVIAECTGREKVGYAIEAGERGVLWVRLKAKGKPAHGSTPMLGVNAILKMAEVLPNLRGIEALEVATPKGAEDLVSAGRSFLAKEAKALGASATGLDKLLNHYSINVGTIHGGTKTNVVPESCQADLDIRIPPGGAPSQVERYLATALPQGFEYEVKNFVAPSYTPSNSPLVKAVKGVAELSLGYPPPAIIIAATSDAPIIRERLKIPAICFGPGYADLAHIRNEYIEAEDVVKFAKIYTLLAARQLKERQPL